MKLYEIEIHRHSSKITDGFGILNYDFIVDIKPAVLHIQNPHVSGTKYSFLVEELDSENPELRLIIFNALKLIFELKLEPKERVHLERLDNESVRLNYLDEPIFTITELEQ